jgi:hypothetical protein
MPIESIRCFAANPVPTGPAPVVPASKVSTCPGSDVELDELLKAYTQQAQAEVQELEAKLAKPKSRKAALVREEGLQQPLDTKNK